MLRRYLQSEMMLPGNVRLDGRTEVSMRRYNMDYDALCSAAHRLASDHSTSRSSSRSALLPTRTTTRSGLARARASASHRDKLTNESRLKARDKLASIHALKGGPITL